MCVCVCVCVSFAVVPADAVPVHASHAFLKQLFFFFSLFLLLVLCLPPYFSSSSSSFCYPSASAAIVQRLEKHLKDYVVGTSGCVPLIDHGRLLIDGDVKLRLESDGRAAKR